MAHYCVYETRIPRDAGVGERPDVGGNCAFADRGTGA